MVAPVNTSSKRRTQRVRNGKILVYRPVGEMADSGPEDDVDGVEGGSQAALGTSKRPADGKSEPAKPTPAPVSAPVASSWLYTTESNLGESWPVIDLVHELTHHLQSYRVSRPKGEKPDAVKIRMSVNLATIAEKLRSQATQSRSDDYKGEIGLRPFLLGGIANGLPSLESIPEIVAWMQVRKDWAALPLSARSQLSRRFENNIQAELATPIPFNSVGEEVVVYIPEYVEQRLGYLKESCSLPNCHAAELAIYCTLIKQPGLDEVYTRQMREIIAEVTCGLMYREKSVRGAIAGWKELQEFENRAAGK